MRSNSFREARERKGLRQVDAARSLGTAQEVLYRIEASKQMPGRDMLIRMADLYGCSVDTLLGRTSELPEVQTSVLTDSPLPVSEGGV